MSTTKDQDWLKILLEVYKAGMHAGWKEHREFRNGTKTTFNNEITIVPKSVEEAKANILSKIESAIGEDEPYTPNGPIPTETIFDGRNQLRAEIRKSLNLDKGKT